MASKKLHLNLWNYFMHFNSWDSFKFHVQIFLYNFILMNDNPRKEKNIFEIFMFALYQLIFAAFTIQYSVSQRRKMSTFSYQMRNYQFTTDGSCVTWDFYSHEWITSWWSITELTINFNEKNTFKLKVFFCTT